MTIEATGHVFRKHYLSLYFYTYRCLPTSKRREMSSPNSHEDFKGLQDVGYCRGVRSDGGKASQFGSWKDPIG